MRWVGSEMETPELFRQIKVFNNPQPSFRYVHFPSALQCFRTTIHI